LVHADICGVGPVFCYNNFTNSTCPLGTSSIASQCASSVRVVSKEVLFHTEKPLLLISFSCSISSFMSSDV
jgi:hypothetical protein